MRVTTYGIAGLVAVEPRQTTLPANFQWRPLHGRSVRQWRGVPPSTSHSPEMSTIYIQRVRACLIRRINYRRFVDAERDVFGLEIAWRQEHRLSARSRNGIKVIPPILLR